jgi:hypothetical protein
MTGQLDLFTEVGTLRGDDMREMAEAWRGHNHEAYGAMVGMALSDLHQGKRGSIDKLANIVRYNAQIRVHYRIDGFRLNNTLRAPLARMMIREHPELADYFETRKSKVDV